jgi:hypothetical protein
LQKSLFTVQMTKTSSMSTIFGALRTARPSEKDPDIGETRINTSQTRVSIVATIFFASSGRIPFTAPEPNRLGALFQKARAAIRKAARTTQFSPEANSRLLALGSLSGVTCDRDFCLSFSDADGGSRGITP